MRVTTFLLTLAAICLLTDWRWQQSQTGPSRIQPTAINTIC